MNSVEEVVSAIESPWKTESAFWSWLRGGIRRGLWANNPIKLAYINFARVRVPLGKISKTNPSGLIWGGKCEQCGQLFRQQDLEVDHISKASALPIRDDLEGFIRNLVLVTFKDLALLCKPCHKIKSHSERSGTTFNEARAIKLAIAACKKPVDDQIKELTALGFKPSMTKNQAARRGCYIEYFSRES